MLGARDEYSQDRCGVYRIVGSLGEEEVLFIQVICQESSSGDIVPRQKLA